MHCTCSGDLVSQGCKSCATFSSNVISARRFDARTGIGWVASLYKGCVAVATARKTNGSNMEINRIVINWT